MFNKIGDSISKGAKIGSEAADLPCFGFYKDVVDLGDFGGTEPFLDVFRDIGYFFGDRDIVRKAFIFMAVYEYPAIEMEEDDFSFGKVGYGTVYKFIWC